MELFCRRWNAQKIEIAKIVLLHGMGGTGSLWRPIAAALEDTISVLAPDQRGHGQSQKPASSYLPEDYGADVIETLGKLEFFPAWLLGHSMGVRTACAAAHLRPDWVQGLILIDLGFSGFAGGGLGPDLANFLKKLPKTFNSRSAAREFMALECPDPSIAQYLMAVAQIQPDQSLAFPFDSAALIQTIESAGNSSVRDWAQVLAQKGMPIFVLRGMQSLVWSQESYLREKDHFKDDPNVQFMEIQGAGHGLPFEKRLELTQLIQTWVSQGRT